MQERMSEETGYPSGQAGELAVCYLGKDDIQYLERVVDEAEADRLFEETRRSDNVANVILERGPNAGKRSSVVWIAQCVGGTEWLDKKVTEGAAEIFE